MKSIVKASTLALLLAGTTAQSAPSLADHLREIADLLQRRRSAVLCLNKRDFPLKELDQIFNESIETVRSEAGYNGTIEMTAMSVTQTTPQFGIVGCVTLKLNR